MTRKRNRRIRIQRTKKSRQKNLPKISPRKIRIKRRVLVPRTAKQFSALPRQTQDRWIRITQAISKMRSDRLSLREASREYDLDPSVLTRLGKSALRKRKNGKYVAKPADKLLRILPVPSKKGLIEVAVSDSHEASVIGEFWNAVDRRLRTGDASGLQKLRKKSVTDANGKRIPLLTDLDELDRQASAGVLQFESLYGRTA
jgi:hypothetical protein